MWDELQFLQELVGAGNCDSHCNSKSQCGQVELGIEYIPNMVNKMGQPLLSDTWAWALLWLNL